MTHQQPDHHPRHEDGRPTGRRTFVRTALGVGAAGAALAGAAITGAELAGGLPGARRIASRYSTTASSSLPLVCSITPR